MGNEGMIILSEALKNNNTLKEIYLNCNNIGKESMIALSEALKINKSLQTIYLRCNVIGDEGLIYLSEGLKINRSLKFIDLSYNSLKNGVDDVVSNIKESNESISIYFNKFE